MRNLMLIAAFIYSGLAFAQDTTTTTEGTEDDANSMTEETQPAAQSESGVTTCTGGGEERKIEIIYETPGSKVPCKVDYTKSTGTTTLWQASAEEGYCESKVQGLIEKLSSSGFECK